MEKILLLSALLFITACSGVITTEQDGISYFYPITEEEARESAGKGLSDEFKGFPIQSIDFPNKGFSVEEDNGLDRHVYTVYYLPETQTIKSEIISGYSFKLEHDGSYLDGPTRAKKAFINIESRAKEIASPLSKGQM